MGFAGHNNGVSGRNTNMNLISWFFVCFTALCSYVGVKAGGHGGGHEHVKIIVPYHVKTHKHTHTIYKTIHHHHDHGHGGGGGGKAHSHGGVPFKWEKWD